MIIKQAEFKGVFVDLKQLPVENRPEIALVGRSNVGKSSLINRLCNRRNLAKSSSTPGKTRTINYYLVNNQWYMVDLPGYGYAKVSKQERARWGKMIESYLSQRRQLKGVLHILDIRHPPSHDDILMKEWLSHQQIPVLIVATKADKISRGARARNLAVIIKELKLPVDLLPLCFSAETGEGIEEIKDALKEILEYQSELD
jgi:GTP-binding protein